MEPGDVRAFLESFALEGLVLFGAGAFIVGWRSRARGSMWGGVVMTGLSALMLGLRDVEPFAQVWRDGGSTSYLLFALGAYGVSAAVASLFSGNVRRATWAAVACAGLAPVLGVVEVGRSWQGLQALLTHVSPLDRAAIEAAARGELVQLVGFSVGVGAVILLTLSLRLVPRLRAVQE